MKYINDFTFIQQTKLKYERRHKTPIYEMYMYVKNKVICSKIV